ncbi:MAG: glycerol-3-phosphate dehydrogenase/oxidase [Syntrophales bacterium]|jgi:glycerol-3-phosphate dehydrogenase|nr:glycerol-3-phosphate dehydrogenase/oxidase [Syntrophales bacterium]MCK9527796.1 glycerol-3-phosphate dehydrogenase/oxidase [Syntrophales bacterium]MDX9922107.1 glycerol-3-phosphate dehydrogenase/oxidase [Syntrophales bacterium]
MIARSPETRLKRLNPDIDDIPRDWDVIIAGGGITGAGILRETVRLGLRAILLEQFDFAWGTSSRSSKLVHGGLRYLREGRFSLTRASVEERRRLLLEAPGLVDPLGFLIPVYKRGHPGKTILSAGLTLYDLMGAGKRHRFLQSAAFLARMPHIRRDGLTGGFSFHDARVDDARLVLRLVNEALDDGAWAANYTAVRHILRDVRGRVRGVAVEGEDGRSRELAGRVVVNATGWWAGTLHTTPDAKRHLRPLRGSHIVYPSWVLPIAQAVTFAHPADRRPIFVIPWEGVVLVGTTDLDHEAGFNEEPAISPEEVSYLRQGLIDCFPSLALGLDRGIATFAGVRPVVSEGNRAPSEESRDHVIWKDRGLITVTGGKLTTFRRIAWDTLNEVFEYLPEGTTPDRDVPVFEPPPDRAAVGPDLPEETWKRLAGRYGKRALLMTAEASPDDVKSVGGTPTLWAEVIEGARREGVKHLDDLLLRRVRLGLLLIDGGMGLLDEVQRRCGPVLPWSGKRWREERNRYRDILERSYGLPGRKPLPSAEKEGILKKTVRRARQRFRL